MGRYIFFQKTLTLGWPRIRLMFPKDHLVVKRDCDERRRRQQYDSDDSDSDLDLTKKILGWEQCNLCSCGFIKWLKINLLSRFNLLSKNMWGLKEQDQDGHGNTGWPWTRWRPGLIKLTKLLLLIVGYLKKFILVSKQIQNNTCCQVAPRAVQAKSNRKNWPIISNFRQRHVPWFAHWEFGMFSNVYLLVSGSTHWGIEYLHNKESKLEGLCEPVSKLWENGEVQAHAMCDSTWWILPYWRGQVFDRHGTHICLKMHGVFVQFFCFVFLVFLTIITCFLFGLPLGATKTIWTPW